MDSFVGSCVVIAVVCSCVGETVEVCEFDCVSKAVVGNFISLVSNSVVDFAGSCIVYIGENSMLRVDIEVEVCVVDTFIGHCAIGSCVVNACDIPCRCVVVVDSCVIDVFTCAVDIGDCVLDVVFGGDCLVAIAAGNCVPATASFLVVANVIGVVIFADVPVCRIVDIACSCVVVVIGCCIDESDVSGCVDVFGFCAVDAVVDNFIGNVAVYGCRLVFEVFIIVDGICVIVFCCCVVDVVIGSSINSAVFCSCGVVDMIVGTFEVIGTSVFRNFCIVVDFSSNSVVDAAVSFVDVFVVFGIIVGVSGRFVIAVVICIFLVGVVVSNSVVVVG